MAETEKRKVPPKRLSGHLLLSKESLFALLEEAYVLLATNSGLFGWPGLNGKMFSGLQVVTDHAYLNQIGELELTGPVKLKTPARFFDCTGMDHWDFQVWGICKPRKNEDLCRWATAQIKTDESGKVTVQTTQHQSGQEVAQAIDINPLNMLIEIHEFMEKVSRRHERDTHKATVMTGTFMALCGLFAEAARDTYSKDSTASSYIKAMLAGRLGSGLLGRSPFSLDAEVVDMIAEARGRN